MGIIFTLGKIVALGAFVAFMVGLLTGMGMMIYAAVHALLISREGLRDQRAAQTIGHVRRLWRWLVTVWWVMMLAFLTLIVLAAFQQALR